jgi:hypothetical protein
LDIRGVIAAAAGGAIVGDNIGFWVGRDGVSVGDFDMPPPFQRRGP